MVGQKSRRKRGVILTSQGLQKLLQARRELAFRANSDEYTIEALSELTGLSSRTVAKVLERQ